MPGAQYHCHFLERGIPRPFADAVDGYLRLARTGIDASQCVRGGQPEVVVTVDRDDTILDTGCVLNNPGDQSAKFIREWNIRPYPGC